MLSILSNRSQDGFMHSQLSTPGDGTSSGGRSECRLLSLGSGRRRVHSGRATIDTTRHLLRNNTKLALWDNIFNPFLVLNTVYQDHGHHLIPENNTDFLLSLGSSRTRVHSDRAIIDTTRHLLRSNTKLIFWDNSVSRHHHHAHRLTPENNIFSFVTRAFAVAGRQSTPPGPYYVTDSLRVSSPTPFINTMDIARCLENNAYVRLSFGSGRTRVHSDRAIIRHHQVPVTKQHESKLRVGTNRLNSLPSSSKLLFPTPFSSTFDMVA